MDFKLMNQIRSGRTLIGSNIRLTPYPVGEFRTPGIGTKSLYSIYTPIYNSKSVSEKKDKPLQDSKELPSQQEGSGDDFANKSGNKQKMNPELYEKLQHHIFKVSKFDPSKKLIKKEEKLGEGSSKKARKVKVVKM